MAFREAGINPDDNMSQIQDYTRKLSVETAMEAIRYNGYVPDSDGKWNCFIVQGGILCRCYGISGRSLCLPFSLDVNHNLEDLQAATDMLPERIIMGTFHIDNDKQGITFIVDGIERNYGHSRDTLNDYSHLLYETRKRRRALYEEFQAKQQKEQITLLQEPRIALPS